MLKELEAKLKAPINFPSPPGVAQQIIAIANDPDVSLARVADIISKDPGLTTKILRTANSPMYAQRRRSDNLRQALIVLGLNAATTLALSFSLVAGFKSGKGTGLDYARFWRRAILGAVISRSLGEQLKLQAGENLFLAGLLQDIAVLALDRSNTSFYAELPKDPTHAQICEYENARLQTDHAAVGAWLFRQWKLPDQLCNAIEQSHAPDKSERGTASGHFARCVGFASEMAESFLTRGSAEVIQALAPRAQKLLGLTREQLGETFNTILQVKPEMESLFETTLLSGESSAIIMDQARELLALRSLESLQQVSDLQKTTDQLVARAEALEDQYRRDALTGLYNRGYLDQYLVEEFNGAKAGGWPLSVVFVDLDHFKRVNDTYGHPAGDTVLRGAARLILGAVRDSDLVARYGGEEFVVVLPSLDQAGAQVVCTRLLESLRTHPHRIGGEDIIATASLGLATLTRGSTYATVEQLVDAADRAVYVAKRAGRNRLASYQGNAGEPVAQSG
jgi:diguanylate cyclase (GGDEF)-like protein